MFYQSLMLPLSVLFFTVALGLLPFCFKKVCKWYEHIGDLCAFTLILAAGFYMLFLTRPDSCAPKNTVLILCSPICVVLVLGIGILFAEARKLGKNNILGWYLAAILLLGLVAELSAMNYITCAKA